MDTIFKGMEDERKKKALAACSSERYELIRCFRKSWPVTCSKENKMFWDCFTLAKKSLQPSDRNQPLDWQNVDSHFSVNDVK